MDQEMLMRFDPATGEPKPYPSHAGQWRAYNGQVAWLFNPWAGLRRRAEDVGTDTFGQLVVPVPWTPIQAALYESSLNGSDNGA